jgi:peptidoglycan/LPS O-acetylase OafA/YrhL
LDGVNQPVCCGSSHWRWLPEAFCGGRPKAGLFLHHASKAQERYEIEFHLLGRKDATLADLLAIVTIMNPLWKIRGLAVALIALYGLGALWAVVELFSTEISLPLFKAVASNLCFVAGGIGLLKLKRWGWWLTIGLCAIIIIQSLCNIFKLTPESATKQHGEPYVVAGFYLAVAFLLARDSVRKVFRETHG